MLGVLGAAWGITGVSLILGSALCRLVPYALELRGLTLTWDQWMALGLSLLFMGYAEGYRAFQLRFSPRTAARSLYLKNNPTRLRVFLAPLFCMGFFHATRRRLIVAYSLTATIILLVVAVRHLDQPWRGIIDAGVLLGLAWGLVSVWVFTTQAFWGKHFDVSPETPDT